MTAKERTGTDRRNATLVGILFIIATGMLFVGEAVYGPVLNSPDYLEIAHPNRVPVIVGLLLEFTIAPAMLLIPVFAYPVLKRHTQTLALAYVGFRLFEAVLVTVIGASRLSLVSLSQAYLNRGALDAAYFQTIGSQVQAFNQWAFSIYVVVFALGGLVFYAALYRFRLLPRWLSGWGFLAAVLMLTGTLLAMLGAPAGLSDEALQLIFATPIAVNEMVLAVWLIVKGFRPAAIVSE